MSDLVQLIRDADFALLEMEQTRVAIEAAKAALEAAKSEYDQAKSAYDEVISRADEIGVPRSKIKKIAEERAAVLAASGLMSVPVNQTRNAKEAKPRKPKALYEKPVMSFDSENAVASGVQLDA